MHAAYFAGLAGSSRAGWDDSSTAVGRLRAPGPRTPAAVGQRPAAPPCNDSVSLASSCHCASPSRVLPGTRRRRYPSSARSTWTRPVWGFRSRCRRTGLSSRHSRASPTTSGATRAATWPSCAIRRTVSRSSKWTCSCSSSIDAPSPTMHPAIGRIGLSLVPQRRTSRSSWPRSTEPGCRWPRNARSSRSTRSRPCARCTAASSTRPRVSPRTSWCTSSSSRRTSRWPCSGPGRPTRRSGVSGRAPSSRWRRASRSSRSPRQRALRPPRREAPCAIKSARHCRTKSRERRAGCCTRRATTS